MQRLAKVSFHSQGMRNYLNFHGKGMFLRDSLIVDSNFELVLKLVLKYFSIILRLEYCTNRSLMTVCQNIT